MKSLVSAIALALIIVLFVPGPGSASPLKRLYFRQPELYLANPSAPELYNGISKMFRAAQQESLARLLPAGKQNVVVDPVNLTKESAKPGNI